MFTKRILTEPAFGGQSCEAVNGGPLTLPKPCNDKACPLDCLLGEWADWGGCSASCGEGSRSSQREVLVEPQGTGQPCEERERS